MRKLSSSTRVIRLLIQERKALCIGSTVHSERVTIMEQAPETAITLTASPMGDSTSDSDSFISVGLNELGEPLVYPLTKPCYNFLVVMAVILSIMAIICIVSDFLMVTLLIPASRSSATLRWILALTITDSFVLVTNILLCACTVTGHFSEDVRVKMKMKMVNYAILGNVYLPLMLSCTWMHVVIMWHRYICIKAKYSTSGYHLRRVPLQALTIFVLSILYCIPQWLSFEIVPDHQLGIWGHKRRAFSRSIWFALWYETIGYFVMHSFLPITLLVCFTFKSVRILVAKSRESTQTFDNKLQQQISFALVADAIIFILFHFIGPILRVILIFYDREQYGKCGRFLFYTNPIHMFVILTQSSLDFFIYVLCVNYLRKQLRNIFRKSGSVEPVSS